MPEICRIGISWKPASFAEIAYGSVEICNACSVAVGHCEFNRNFCKRKTLLDILWITADELPGKLSRALPTETVQIPAASYRVLPILQNVSGSSKCCRTV